MYEVGKNGFPGRFRFQLMGEAKASGGEAADCLTVPCPVFPRLPDLH
jgi:hypothetical protein